MPTFPGPWQASPGPLTIDGAHTAPGVASVQYERDVSSTDFPTLCEPAPVSGGYGFGSNLRIAHDFGPGDFYTIYQAKVVYQISDDLFLLPIAWAPPLPWPAGAVDWAWENRDVQLWVTSVDVTVGVADDAGFAVPFREDVTLLLQAADPTTLTLFPSGLLAGLPEDRPIPGADLVATHATAMSAATSAATLTANLDRTSIKDIGDLAAAYNPLTVVLSFDNMRTHVPTAVGMGRWLVLQYPPTCAINFTPPRWRFLYEARAPLAHRQRRDGTATTGPQLAHIGTPGGRPPLAWRQNNP